MSDYDALMSLKHPVMPDPEEAECKDRQARYLADSGSNYQSQGYIQFQPSASGVDQEWVDFSDSSSRLEVPVQIAFANYPVGTGAPAICFKAGYLSFLSNLTMTCGGKIIISEGPNATYLTAFTRLFIERSNTWLASDAADFAFAPYSNTSTVPGSNAGLQTMVNQVAQDFVWVPSTSGSSTAYYQGVVSIPLNVIHPLFQTLGVKKFSVDQLRFFPSLQTAQYSPIVVCPSTLPSGYTTLPTISIFGSLGSCRLRYQAITPTKEQMAMANRSYDSVSKHFYRQVQLGLQYPATSQVNQIKQLIEIAVVRVERLTLFRWPATVSAAPGGTSGTYAPTSCFDLLPIVSDQTYALSQIQAFRGSAPYFSDQLAIGNIFGLPDDRDLFAHIKDISPGTVVPYESGSFLSLSNWRSTYNWTVLNLSRDGHNHDDAAQHNFAQQIMAQYSVNNGNPVAVPYLFVPVLETLGCVSIKSGKVVSTDIPTKRAC